MNRTVIFKLLWLILIRGDIAYAAKELNRDMIAPTIQSVANLKHLLRYLIGTKMWYLRLRPSYQLSDGNYSLDVSIYTVSDWAGYSKIRKSISGSIVNILGYNMVSEHFQDPSYIGILKWSCMRLDKECQKHCFFGQYCLKQNCQRRSL